MITLAYKEKEVTICFEKDITLLSLTYEDDFWDRVERVSGHSVMIDFQYVNFIDSVGIEFLIRLVFQLQKENTIYLCNMSHYVKELIEMSELNLLVL